MGFLGGEGVDLGGGGGAEPHDPYNFAAPNSLLSFYRHIAFLNMLHIGLL